MSNSHYAYQLEPYLSLFNDVFIESFESMKIDPDRFCEKLFEWIGVSNHPLPKKDAYNVTPQTMSSIDESTIFGNLASKVKKSPIRNIVPAPIRQLLVQSLTQKINIDFGSEEFIKDINVAKKLSDKTLKKWVDELEQLTDRSYSEWSFG